MYACKTWSITQGYEEKLLKFERKVLWKNLWYNKPNIGKYLKTKRLEWAGLVWRADGSLIHNVLVEKINRNQEGDPVNGG